MKSLLITLALVLSTYVHSAEVDQFSQRDVKLRDSGSLVNMHINQFLHQSVQILEQKNKGCDEAELYKQTNKFLSNHVFGKIVQSIEEDGDIQKLKTQIKDSIYSKWDMLDGVVLGRPGAETSPLAMSSLIQFGPYEIGVDKIEHLFDRGFAYFKEWNDGKYIDAVLINGVWWEKAFFGGAAWGTGVFSYGDLAANFNGLRFWNDLLAKRRDILGKNFGPYVACNDGKFEVVKEIDLLNYIDESFDESINCSTYPSEKTLKKAQAKIASLGMKCPLDSTPLEKLERKYGPYAKLVINSQGPRVTESEAEWKQITYLEEGWEPVPKEFLPYLRPRLRDLKYSLASKFLREFKAWAPSSHKSNGPDTRFVSWDEITIVDEAPQEIKKCWGVFVSGGECGREIIKPRPDAYTESGELDLLTYIRDVSYRNGLAVARDVLSKELTKRDASKGEIRNRILNATKNPEVIYEDSFANIPMEERKEIGVFLVLGIGGEKSPNAALIHSATAAVNSLGFSAEMLEVDPNLGSAHNAKMLNQMMKERFPKFKKIAIVAASKGAADFITYFLNYAQELPEQEREKLRLMCTLSGVLRPSMVANYLSQSNRATALLVRNGLKVMGRGSILDGIKSLAIDPWAGHDPKEVHHLFPNMRWLSLPSLPEGRDGVTHLSMWEGFLKTPSYRWNKEASPMDGLVESAASVLPPDTGIEETIVPIYGPHAMALGSYTKDLQIAPQTMGGITDRVEPEAGAEILNAFFRALPKEWLE